MTLAMRLQAKSFPDALDRRMGQVALFGDRANCPVCTVLGFCVESLTDQQGNGFVRNGAGPTRTQLFMKSREPLLKIALAPFTEKTERKFLESNRPLSDST